LLVHGVLNSSVLLPPLSLTLNMARQLPQCLLVETTEKQLCTVLHKICDEAANNRNALPPRFVETEEENLADRDRKRDV
jgi:hypothetical protein